ncbi:MAG: FHA domain-containing protein [Gammaproteobacteria bacterium]|nr:FHA domain-containing protein [Gammaproteobacteria bacterium]
MAKLVVKHDGIVLKDFPIDKNLISIGRNTGNDIQLDDAAVSGQHAQIVVEPNEYLDDHNNIYIEDLDSTNGTQVNGLAITRHLLKNGDQLQIGKHKLSYDSELDHRHDQTAIYIPEN